MKFGRLTEYTRKTFSFENHIQNVVEKLFPDPSKSKSSVSLDQQSKVLYILFLLHVKLRTIEICLI